MSTDQFIFFQTAINGVLAGSLFGVIALGLTLTWGLLRIANFAHLSFVLFAAYISYELTVNLGWDPLATLIVVMPIFFVVGIGVQWVFLRFKVTTFTSLLLTFGLFIVLENVMTFIWTADTITSRRALDRAYRTAISLPPPFDQFFVLPPDLLSFIAAVILGALIYVLLHFTQWGRAVRALAQDPVIAQAFGINYQREALLLAGLATMTAGVAGVLVGIKMQLFPSLPIAWIGTVVAAVILGGLGRPIGAIVAAMSLSLIEGLWSINQQPSTAPLISFSILVLVLIVQPGVLFKRWRERRRAAQQKMKALEGIS